MQIATIEGGRNTTNHADWRAPGATTLSLVDRVYVNPKAGLGEQVQRRSRFSGDSLPEKFATARDIFASSKEKKSAVAYDLEMDAVLYRVLAEQKGKPEYEASRDALNAYVRMQLETHLGERLHVGISKFVYKIVDGQLVSEHTNEPALNMIVRGRDYRRKHGNETDREREEAEVVGFEKIQAIMADDNTPIGTMVMFASPPGDASKKSNYPMNLYEVHQKVADNQSVAYRFTSGRSARETRDKLAVFEPWYQQEGIPTAAEFIEHVVRLPFGLFKSPEDVHAYMHKKHEHLNGEDFGRLRQSWQPIMDKIVGDFERDPNNSTLHNNNHRALLNYADESHDTYHKDKMTITTDAHREIGGPAVRPWVAPQIDMYSLSSRKVRFVIGGCGPSGDSKKAASVGEFDPKTGTYSGENAKNDPNLCKCGGKEPHFHCDGNGSSCGHAIIVGKGTSECPKCGAGKVC